jgi:alanyl-tRNA synthetase
MGSPVKSADIRKRFLSYFQGHGHRVVPSSSLIPHDDPTLFFVNAGMVQFKDVFTGREQRDYTRAATVQKCLRVSGKQNDLDNVGRTARHHTFFEMLGNFSFGDYFKSDAIPMAWELLTKDLGIAPERLWVTIYDDDDEADAIWRSIGFPAARIQRLGAKDNFWSMGETGPCGPCSEIHYDHGANLDPNGGGPATGSARYVEIWNLVFMQFEQTAAGRTPLPRPSIDTGAGLERVAAVLQGVYSNYDTDGFQPLIRRAATESGVAYGKSDDTDTSLRVIADHARATAFLVADGVMPSNEGRGYVLRRIMRRAIRFGVKLGFERPFLHMMTDQVARDMGEAYPELAARSRFVEEVVRGEEERFRRTIDRGSRLLDAELTRAGRGGTVPGDVAFTLSDTYGFPLDLTELIAEEQGVKVDKPGYDAALGRQKARGRAAWKGSGEQAVAGLWIELAKQIGETEFTGYDHAEHVATVLAAIKQTRDADGALHSEVVDRLELGEHGIVVLDRTPFYGESGGQTGDKGSLSAGTHGFAVSDTVKASGLHLHVGEVRTGSIGVGDSVTAAIEDQRRASTRRNHTATHLLHAALRAVLGEHVTQKGSLVGPDRLRFDFAHHRPMTGEELAEVERRVNAQILANTALETSVEDLDAAKAHGAMALFGEKYDAKVRVVRVPGFSVELCGGTHVRRTGDIGLFRIVSEAGVAAGVRRIEAQTGEGAMAWVSQQVDTLNRAAATLRTSPDQLVDAIARIQDERKAVERELDAMKRDVAKKAAGDLVGRAQLIGGIKVLAVEFDGDLREQADRLRDQLGSSIVVLGSKANDKVVLLAAASSDIAGSKVHAGKVIGEIAPMVGGRGGGRPDMAQAGGKDVAGLAGALEKAYAVVKAQIEAGA